MIPDIYCVLLYIGNIFTVSMMNERVLDTRGGTLPPQQEIIDLETPLYVIASFVFLLFNFLLFYCATSIRYSF